MTIPTPTPTPDDEIKLLSEYTDAELVELYQQISGRVALYNADVQIDWMFSLRGEILKRLAVAPKQERDAARAEVLQLKIDIVESRCQRQQEAKEWKSDDDLAEENRALRAELAKAQTALYKIFVLTGEEAGDPDDFRALVDREGCVVEAVRSLRAELEASSEAVTATRQAAIEAMRRIRDLVGATDADKEPAEHFVRLRMTELDLAGELLRRVTEHQRKFFGALPGRLHDDIDNFLARKNWKENPDGMGR